jgi:hypothetical protein
MKRRKNEYLVSFSDRFLSYLYPIFLLALEWFLRLAFQLDTQEFVGPTLAATSVGMVIPMISYRSAKGISNSLSEETIQQIKKLEEMGAKIECGRSIVFRNFCFVVALFFTLIWVATIVISTKFPTTGNLWGWSLSYILGFACYFLGFLLSEIKEFV